MSTFIRGIGRESNGFAVGSADVKKIYLGTTKIYDTSGYDAEIEYLESSGTQYIETGVKIDGTKSELRMRFSGFQNKYFGNGCRTSYNSKAFIFSNGGDTGTKYNKYFLNYGTVYDANITWPNDSSIHEVVMSNSVVVDGVLKKTFSAVSFTSDADFRLFATQSSDGSMYYGYMRLYSCSLYNNGAKVRDFIPVRKGSVGYLYDKVSGQFFGNDGTGSFILGPDVQ